MYKLNSFVLIIFSVISILSCEHAINLDSDADLLSENSDAALLSENSDAPLFSKNSDATSSLSLSSQTQAQIVNKVIEATDKFKKANSQLDSDGVLNYWDFNNPNFIFVENTDIHPSGQEFQNLVKQLFSEGIESTHITWKKRDILPLSKTSAHLYGEYDFYVKLKSGKVWNCSNLYSALFTEIDGNWKAVRVHETYNVEE